MIGCDVVSVDRIAAALRRDGFAERVFTARERDDARRGGVAPGSSTETARLAARFAAKEAARKALGDLSLGFHDTEVRTRGDGAPELWVGDRRLHVSLTHDAGIAMAVVADFGSGAGPSGSPGVSQAAGAERGAGTGTSGSPRASEAVGAERDGSATSREGREKNFLAPSARS